MNTNRFCCLVHEDEYGRLGICDLSSEHQESWLKKAERPHKIVRFIQWGIMAVGVLVSLIALAFFVKASIGYGAGQMTFVVLLAICINAPTFFVAWVIDCFAHDEDFGAKYRVF